MKLAVTPLLRTLATEHGPGGPQTVPLIVQQAIGDGGTHQTCRGFRPQRERIAVAVREGEHFLLDDIRIFANGALEQCCLLEQRQAHFLIAVSVEHFARSSFQEMPPRHVRGKHIVHAAQRLDRRVQDFIAPINGVAVSAAGRRR